MQPPPALRVVGVPLQLTARLAVDDALDDVAVDPEAELDPMLDPELAFELDPETALAPALEDDPALEVPLEAPGADVDPELDSVVDDPEVPPLSAERAPFDMPHAAVTIADTITPEMRCAIISRRLAFFRDSKRA